MPMRKALGWCILLAAFGAVNARHCSFTNIHPSSTGAYITLTSAQNTYTSPVADYDSTSYFECMDSTSLTLRAYDKDDVPLLFGTSQLESRQVTLSCQATNMFTLEPLQYGLATYDIDMDVGRYMLTPNRCRLMLLNTGYDGPIYWEHRDSLTAEWEGVSSRGPVYTLFGFGGLYADVDVDTEPNNQFRVTTAPGSGYTVLATADFLSLTDYDKTTQYHINLIGHDATDWELYVVPACNNATSNCNTCPTPSPSTSPTPAPPSLSPTRQPTPTTGSPTVSGSSTIAQGAVFDEIGQVADYTDEIKDLYNKGYGYSLGIVNQNGLYAPDCFVSSTASLYRRAVLVTFTAVVSAANSAAAIEAAATITSAMLTANTQAVASAIGSDVVLPEVGTLQGAVASTPAPPPSEEGGDNLTLPIVALVAAGVSTSCLACLALYWCHCRPKWTQDAAAAAEGGGDLPPTYITSYLRGDEQVANTRPDLVTAPPGYDDEYEAPPQEDLSVMDQANPATVTLDVLTVNPAVMPVFSCDAEPHDTALNGVGMEMGAIPTALPAGRVSPSTVVPENSAHMNITEGMLYTTGHVDSAWLSALDMNKTDDP